MVSRNKLAAIQEECLPVGDDRHISGAPQCVCRLLPRRDQRCGGVGDRTGDTGGGAQPPTRPLSIGSDLETACGEAGLAMVAAESDELISQVQQAALDALRGICATGDAASGTSGAPTGGHPGNASAGSDGGASRAGIGDHRPPRSPRGRLTRMGTITAVTAVTMTTRRITDVMGRTTRSSRPSIQGLTGLVVFIAGIFALHATTTAPRSSDSCQHTSRV